MLFYIWLHYSISVAKDKCRSVICVKIFLKNWRMTVVNILFSISILKCLINVLKGKVKYTSNKSENIYVILLLKMLNYSWQFV